MARVVVTRPAGQEADLVERLRLLGHDVDHVPLIAVEPVGDDPVDVDGYDWVVVTSVNGARELLRRRRGRLPRVAAIGAATASVLGGADLVPRVSTQEGLLEELPRPAGRVLFAAAEGARPLLAEALAADVAVLYRTLELVPAEPLTGDLVVLASASAARALAATGSQLPAVSIGPETTRAARQSGAEVLAEAATHDLEGLVAAVESAAGELDRRRFLPPISSPRLERLAGDEAAAEKLLAELAGAAPLIEEIEGDPSHRLVTVVARGPGRVHWAGGFAGAGAGNDLLPVEGTSLVARSLRLPVDVSTLYWLVRDGGTVEPDPLAAERYTMQFPTGQLDGSVLRMPGAAVVPSPASARTAASVERRRFRSDVLGNDRDVWVHVPSGGGAGAALLVLLDGHAYAGDLDAPGTLDRLIRSRALPPVVAIMPDSLDQETRARELACNATHVRHLVEELLPWARGLTGATDDPARTVVGGLSFGGLAAAYAAHLRPDVFGTALAQSGAFHWSHESLAGRISGLGRPPARLSLECGLLENGGDFRILADETTLLAANRRLRPVIERAGAEVRYVEFPGGHDHHWWASLLPDALVWAFGAAAGR